MLGAAEFGAGAAITTVGLGLDAVGVLTTPLGVGVPIDVAGAASTGLGVGLMGAGVATMTAPGVQPTQSPPPLVQPNLPNTPEGFSTTPDAGQPSIVSTPAPNGPTVSNVTLGVLINGVQGPTVTMATPADVLAGSTPDADKPILKDGTLQQTKPGGMAAADADFDSMHPSKVDSRPAGVRIGNLDDGTQIIVRPKSVPSVEINPPTGPSYVIRYK